MDATATLPQTTTFAFYTKMAYPVLVKLEVSGLHNFIFSDFTPKEEKDLAVNLEKCLNEAGAAFEPITKNWSEISLADQVVLNKAIMYKARDVSLACLTDSSFIRAHNDGIIYFCLLKL